MKFVIFRRKQHMFPNASKVLFLIVGTGDSKRQDYPEYYLNLLRKAIDGAEAKNVVLIPSGKSLENAEKIKAEYDSRRKIVIERLTEKSMEFDVDKCYKYFEDLFQKQFQQGFLPENFIIDFTHGTKTMSAALYAIGMRYRVSDFHYIKRNNSADGTLAEGETVQTFDASYARCLSVLDQCRLLFETWQFSAAKSLLNAEKPSNKEMKTRFDRVQRLADFYAAWDRMDYNEAYRSFPMFQIDGFQKFIPSDDIQKWVDILRQPITETGDCDKPLTDNQKQVNANLSENLLADLYANALRRIESGALEDAGIRIYRIAELIGQACLFKKGYVSNQMPSIDDTVRLFAENNGIRLKNGTDVYEFGREKAIEFLKKISSYGDVFYETATFLTERNNEIRALRNTSVLIHGFSAKASSAESMKKLLNDLLKPIKLIYGSENATIKLQTALFMNKFKDTP